MAKIRGKVPGICLHSYSSHLPGTCPVPGAALGSRPTAGGPPPTRQRRSIIPHRTVKPPRDKPAALLGPGELSEETRRVQFSFPKKRIHKGGRGTHVCPWVLVRGAPERTWETFISWKGYDAPGTLSSSPRVPRSCCDATVSVGFHITSQSSSCKYALKYTYVRVFRCKLTEIFKHPP